MSLKTVPTASLETLFRAIHKAQIPCPLRADTLACIGLQERQEPILAALRGLAEPGVRAVLVNVLAERRGSVRTEIERPLRDFRRSELAPVGANSSDEGGLHRPSRSESSSMLENCQRTPIGVPTDPLEGVHDA